MWVYRTPEGVRVLSDSDLLVMFVTEDGEGIVRNISGRHKIVQSWKVWKRM
jgi:hypothetical protein